MRFISETGPILVKGYKSISDISILSGSYRSAMSARYRPGAGIPKNRNSKYKPVLGMERTMVGKMIREFQFASGLKILLGNLPWSFTLLRIKVNQGLCPKYPKS